MKIPKAFLKKNHGIIFFYTTMTSVILCGFLISGKSISAYTDNLDATFYTKQNNYSVTLTSNTSTRNMDSDDIETITRQLRVNYEQALEETSSDSQSELMQEFLPIGLPIEGTITSEYGARVDPISGNNHYHDGTDIALDEGTPIYANANGIVTVSKYSDSYGLMVEIQHIQGYSTVYAHNSDLSVDVGDYVLKGDLIALSGNTGDSTGPHLHYEVRLAEESIPPIMDEHMELLAADE